MKPAVIRDLVGVRPHPTVLRLDDLGRPDSSWIAESFVVTPDVDAHLQVLRRLLAQPSGCGVFLIGHYGSGKSHFLAYLLQQGDALPDPPPVITAVSLVNYSAQTRLEDIIAKAHGVVATPGDRRAAWATLRDPPGGRLLLIDELSEFLRSKPSRESFNEDLRFLQFMGEWAQGARFWVLAAMQEQIEHTGDLEYEIYRKIKDRYPVRFLLTPSHIRDLIARGILLKHPGYDEAVEEVIARLRRSLPPGSKPDEEAIRAVYPLHPATIDFLSEVRDRFSQARGIVDFVTTQLAGNAPKSIPAFLDREWGSFVTPESIVDHYQDLFEIQPEFLTLAQSLFPYYRANMPKLFATEAGQRLGWSLVKLLVLVHLSPAREALTAAEAAAWLFYTASRTDVARNVKIIDGALQKLADQGRYVARRGATFTLSLADRAGEDFDKMLSRELAELQGRGAVVFEAIAQLRLEGDFSPFALPRDQWQSRTLRWHFHERPFSVFAGNADPGVREGAAFCIRLPWGSPEPAFGVTTLIPAQINLTEELIELAALARMREHAAAGPVSQRIDRRLRERLALFQAQVRSAYLEATITGSDGAAEAPPRFDTSGTLDAWLDRYGVWLLRRLYPSFERFAPEHGPLPKEAYRTFMRFAMQHDLGEYEADEFVKLMREAYLVPMGLLARKGRDYTVIPRLDRNELVTLLLPLLEHSPAPQPVYEHLAGPVYGLVPDQMHLLLIFLLLQGDIDILKDRRSYRDIYETLPTPIQYDRIVPGKALSVEQLRALEVLCEARRVRVPKQWTVASQRRAIQELQAAGRAESLRLQPPLMKLAELGEGQELAEKMQRVIALWGALQKGDHELQGFTQFLYEAGSAERFLALAADVADAPAHLQQVLGELQRIRHLFSHPTITASRQLDLRSAIESLGPQPRLDEPQELDRWLADARRVYDEHKRAYAGLHDAWWARPELVWSWQPPRAAASRHVGLTEELRLLEQARERARRLRCRALVNLDYQPVCSCGFDGRTAPADEEMRAFAETRAKIEEQLRLFFAQDSVRRRMMQGWLEIETTGSAQSYVEGREPVPEIIDVDRFDEFIAGAELVKELDLGMLATSLAATAWERPALVKAIDAMLAPYDPARIRLRAEAPGEPDELLQWAAEQCVRHGVALPARLSPAALRRISECLRVEWVSESALRSLDVLGLDEAGEHRIVGWMIDGLLPLPTESCPLAAAAVEILRPIPPQTPQELQALSHALYLQHHRLMAVASDRWLARLDQLATGLMKVDSKPIPQALADFCEHQWVVIDCAGLPLLPALGGVWEEAFPHWIGGSFLYATAPAATTTDAFYRELVASGPARSFAKIDVVDQLLHRRFLPFGEMCRVIAAELTSACRRVARSADRSQPILIFADHGFRLARDGRSFTHGGSSTLERLVPVMELAPRSATTPGRMRV